MLGREPPHQQLAQAQLAVVKSLVVPLLSLLGSCLVVSLFGRKKLEVVSLFGLQFLGC